MTDRTLAPGQASSSRLRPTPPPAAATADRAHRRTRVAVGCRRPCNNPSGPRNAGLIGVATMSPPQRQIQPRLVAREPPGGFKPPGTQFQYNVLAAGGTGRRHRSGHVASRGAPGQTRRMTRRRKCLGAGPTSRRQGRGVTCSGTAGPGVPRGLRPQWQPQPAVAPAAASTMRRSPAQQAQSPR